MLITNLASISTNSAPWIRIRAKTLFCCNSPLCCVLFFLPTPAFCGVFTVPCRRPPRLRPSANDKNQPKQQQQRQKPRQDNNNNNKKKPQKQQQGKPESCADAPARNVDAKLEQRQQRIPCVSQRWQYLQMARFHRWSTGNAIVSGPVAAEENAGCTFTALLKFPSSFPSYPPTMTFLTDILHPNIDTSGKVCISILHPPGIDPLGYEQASERWNCDRTVESILVSIQLLLAEPNFNSPANVDAAVLFRSDPERYREEVRRRVEMVMAAPTQPEGQGTMQKQGQKSERRKRKAQKSENSKLAKGEKRNLQHPCLICNDVWMDILPFFDHAQLGLKMALIPPHFNALVDAHFDGKTTELTLCRPIIIHYIESKTKVSVRIGHNYMHFPLPDRPLPNKIRFKRLYIHIIDHSVIAFLRANKQIWERMGAKLELSIANDQPIWDVFVREIWPIISANIRHLGFPDGAHLDNLRRRTSPTILTDLNINSINSGDLCPVFVGPNASAGQALAKWLHTPRKDGQAKELRCPDRKERNPEWVNNFKELFVRARTSVSYTVHFHLRLSTPIVPFELKNERTKEKLTLSKESSDNNNWLLKRCPIIIGETAAVQQQKNNENLEDNLNNVFFRLHGFPNCIGPLSPPADKSFPNVCSSAAGPSSDQRNK
ncbi:hypothetical protein niasHT_034813 [Heterodera trifolii]|uniref:UBC core domain-containing protein n=1 Tax=Heterodera trifolii TaxID=157864 RepID=A0ABD2I6W0_9BILA